MHTSLEDWTAKELYALDIDVVFAPYIIGMIDSNTIDLSSQIIEVVMGWCAPSQEVGINTHIYLYFLICNM